MPEPHLFFVTLEILASITETRRRVAQTHKDLDELISKSRETLAESHELLQRANKLLDGH